MTNYPLTRETEYLKNALISGDLVLFIGAGLSIGAGLPDWLELIRPLAQSVGFNLPEDRFVTTDHLLNAAQYYENQDGRHKLIEHLRHKLDTTHIAPTPVHR